MSPHDGGAAAADLVRTAGSHVTSLGGRLVHLEVVPGTDDRPGTPILLLPGCAVPSYAFRPVQTALPGRWLVALDRPGMVDTPWPGHLPTLAEEVATLLALCEAVGTPPVVVAHSMAGPHAEALVREHPGSVSGVVLLDASIEVDARRPSAAFDRAWLAASRLALEGSRLPPFAVAAALSTRVAVWSQSQRLRINYSRPPGTEELFRRPDTLATPGGRAGRVRRPARRPPGPAGDHDLAGHPERRAHRGEPHGLGAQAAGARPPDRCGAGSSSTTAGT